MNIWIPISAIIIVALIGLSVLGIYYMEKNKVIDVDDDNNGDDDIDDTNETDDDNDTNITDDDIIDDDIIDDDDTNNSDDIVDDDNDIDDDIEPTNTYYVSPLGNDNNLGTLSSPWKTIQKAANTLVAGDTVLVRTGIYNQQIRIEIHSGIKDKPIVFKAYPGETPIIDGNGLTFPSWGEGLVQIDHVDYIIFDGFKVQNSYRFGIRADSSNHIVIKNNHCYRSYWSGIKCDIGFDYSISDTPATDIIISYNLVEESNKGMNQEAISTSMIDKFQIIHNIVKNSYKEGIDTKGCSSNGIVAYNTVYSTMQSYIAPGIYVGQYSDGLCHNIDIYSNIVYGDHCGIYLGAEEGGTISDINIYNNIVYVNNPNGFAMIHSAKSNEPSDKFKMSNVHIINNVFHMKGDGVKINHYPLKVPGLIIRNNIFSGCGLSLFKVTENDITIDHNLFSGYSNYYGENYIKENPNFINELMHDYHLLSNSPCIDTGANLNAPNIDYDGIERPIGLGYDIGAFER